MAKRFIVKVQISLQTTEHCSQVLVYDERRSIKHQFDSYAKLAKRVGPKMKRYFWAHIDNKN